MKQPHLPAGFSPKRASQRVYLVSYACVSLFFCSLLLCIISIRMHALITLKSVEESVTRFGLHDIVIMIFVNKKMNLLLFCAAWVS